MKRYQKFLVFWIINSLTLYLSNIFFPNALAIGNSILVPYQSIVLSGFIWSAVLWYTEVVLKDMEIPTKSNSSMMLAYFAVNFSTVWLMARFSFITGLGVANFLYVAGIALVANLVQYFAWQYMDKKK